jgi:hypothetical protein
VLLDLLCSFPSSRSFGVAEETGSNLPWKRSSSSLSRSSSSLLKIGCFLFFFSALNWTLCCLNLYYGLLLYALLWVSWSLPSAPNESNLFILPGMTAVTFGRALVSSCMTIYTYSPLILRSYSPPELSSSAFNGELPSILGSLWMSALDWTFLKLLFP